MIGSGIDPKLASRQMDSAELVRFKQQMDGLKQRISGGGEDTTKKLRQACQKFEAVFISKLWKEMKSTVPKEGYMHSKQEEQYMSMFDTEFAEKMAKSGGIGLADMIFDQLSERLKQTSRDALPGGVRIKPIEPQPIALNRGGTPIALPQQKQGMTLEDWGGAQQENAGTAREGSLDSASQIPAATSAPRPVTEMDVKAQLDNLTRRLEAERIKGELLGNGRTGYGQSGATSSQVHVGSKLAENG